MKRNEKTKALRAQISKLVERVCSYCASIQYIRAWNKINGSPFGQANRCYRAKKYGRGLNRWLA